MSSPKPEPLPPSKRALEEVESELLAKIATLEARLSKMETTDPRARKLEALLGTAREQHATIDVEKKPDDWFGEG